MEGPSPMLYLKQDSPKQVRLPRPCPVKCEASPRTESHCLFGPCPHHSPGKGFFLTSISSPMHGHGHMHLEECLTDTY